jgi:spermidine synthase
MKPTTTLATSHTPDGERLILQEHDGQYFMKVGGVQLMGTNTSSSEQEMADIACAKMPANPRILIGGLGFGYTLRRVLELCPAAATVHVAELLQVVVDWNREFLSEVNGALLDDPRVEIRLMDVGAVMDRAEQEPYDAILLDVDNSPDPLVRKGNAGLYDSKGITRTKAALRRGGRVVFWSANQDKSFTAALRKEFGNAEAIPAKAYPKAKRFTHTLFVADKISTSDKQSIN